MTRPHLLAFCFIADSTSRHAQNVFTQIISGFTSMKGGKAQWVDLDNDNDPDLIYAGSDGSAVAIAQKKRSNCFLR